MDLEPANFGGYNLRKSIFYGILFFVVTGVVTGVIPNPLYVRMVPIRWWDYLFLLTTSFLGAAFFGKKECSVEEGRLAKIGGVTGFFAFSCPVCNAALLALFSSSAIMTYFDPVRPFLGVISTAILAYFLLRK